MPQANSLLLRRERRAQSATYAVFRMSSRTRLVHRIALLDGLTLVRLAAAHGTALRGRERIVHRRDRSDVGSGIVMLNDFVLAPREIVTRTPMVLSD
jgi:hypothetical protein